MKLPNETLNFSDILKKLQKLGLSKRHSYPNEYKVREIILLKQHLKIKINLLYCIP